MNRPGIRFTVSRHNYIADIAQLTAALVSSFEDARRKLDLDEAV